MAKAIRRSGVRLVPLSEIKDDLSRFLREAEAEEIVITRNGKPAGLLIGSRPRMIGSITGSKTTRAFCAGSNRRERVYARGAASGLRMSSEYLEPRD
jgi:prevent-host-death family protein